jgi:hypothetical protein
MDAAAADPSEEDGRGIVMKEGEQKERGSAAAARSLGEAWRGEGARSQVKPSGVAESWARETPTACIHIQLASPVSCLHNKILIASVSAHVFFIPVLFACACASGAPSHMCPPIWCQVVYQRRRPWSPAGISGHPGERRRRVSQLWGESAVWYNDQHSHARRSRGGEDASCPKSRKASATHPGCGFSVVMMGLRPSFLRFFAVLGPPLAVAAGCGGLPGVPGSLGGCAPFIV